MSFILDALKKSENERQRQSVAVAFLGKIKTASQMIAILFLLYFKPVGMMDIAAIGGFLMYLAAFLTLLSMAYYLKAAWPQIRDK